MGIKDEIARIIAGGAKQLALPAPKAAKEGIKVFHASPHRFNRFSNHNAFGGEGAQMFGPGNYFSDSPAISGERGHYWEQFNNKLKSQAKPIDATTFYELTQRAREDYLWHKRNNYYENGELDPADTLRTTLDNFGYDKNMHGPKNFNILKDLTVNLDKYDTKTMNANIDYLINNYNKETIKHKGKEPYTYEALIHANPDDLINQDYSLATQPEIYNKLKGLDGRTKRIDEEKLTQAFLNETDIPFYDAQDLLGRFIKEYSTPTNWGYDPTNAGDIVKAGLHYKNRNEMPLDLDTYFNEVSSLVQLGHRPDMKSYAFQPYDKGKRIVDELTDLARVDKSLDFEALMKDLDIPGTRYLAGGSRSGRKSNPDHNYTIWDPSKINIMKRYAVPGMLAGGALAGSGYFSDEANAEPIYGGPEPYKGGELKAGPKPTLQNKIYDWLVGGGKSPRYAEQLTSALDWSPASPLIESYNTTKYASEGDVGNAALSAAGTVPGGALVGKALGAAAAGAKVAGPALLGALKAVLFAPPSAKNAVPELAQKALDLKNLAKGGENISPQEIHEKTGYFMDGQYQLQKPVSTAGLELRTKPTSGVYSLDELVKQEVPEIDTGNGMFDAFPELKNMLVHITEPGGKGVNGQFRSQGTKNLPVPHVVVSPKQVENPRDFMNTLVHELEHGVQYSHNKPVWRNNQQYQGNFYDPSAPSATHALKNAVVRGSQNNFWPKEQEAAKGILNAISSYDPAFQPQLWEFLRFQNYRRSPLEEDAFFAGNYWDIPAKTIDSARAYDLSDKPVKELTYMRSPMQNLKNLLDGMEKTKERLMRTMGHSKSQFK